MGARFAARGHMMGARMGKRGDKGMSGGEITKVAGNTVTVKLSNATTKDITLSDTVSVNTLTKGTKSDIKVGDSMMVTSNGFWNGTQTVVVKPKQ